MPQLPGQMVKARAARLRAAAATRRRTWLESLVGTTQAALIEGEGRGHTDNFAPFTLAGASRGRTGNVRITASNGDCLTAVWA